MSTSDKWIGTALGLAVSCFAFTVFGTVVLGVDFKIIASLVAGAIMVGVGIGSLAAIIIMWRNDGL